MLRQRTQIQYDINYILQPKQIFERKVKAQQTNHKILLRVKVFIIHQHSLKAKIPLQTYGHWGVCDPAMP